MDEANNSALYIQININMKYLSIFSQDVRKTLQYLYCLDIKNTIEIYDVKEDCEIPIL